MKHYKTPDHLPEKPSSPGLALLAFLCPPVTDAVQEITLPDGRTAYSHTFTPSSEPFPWAVRAALLREAFDMDDETIRELIGDPPAQETQP